MIPAARTGLRRLACDCIETTTTKRGAAATAQTASWWPVARVADGARRIRSRLKAKSRTVASATTDATTKPYEAIPGPRGLPLIGSALDYTADIIKIGRYNPQQFDKALRDRHNEYGPIFREKLMNDEFVYVSDPRDIEVLIANEGKSPCRPHLDAIAESRKQENLPVGITALQGDEWLRNRRAANPALMSVRSIAKARDAQRRAAEDFVAYMKRSRSPSTGEIADFEYCLNRWALESVAVVLLDTRLDLFSATNSETKRAGEKLHRCMDVFFDYGARLTFGVPLWKVFDTRAWRVFRKSQRDEFKYAGFLVDEKLRKLEEGGGNSPLREVASKCPFSGGGKKSRSGGDDGKFVSLLEHVVNGSELSRDEALTLCLEMLAGGIDTTSTCTIFLLYQLSKNKHYQEHLRLLVRHERARTVAPEGGREGGEFSRWIKACAFEAMRLNPLTYANQRQTEKDLVLSGHRVPKGTVVRFTSHLINLKDAKYFPEPDRFIPERWLSRDSPHRCTQQFTFTPFGHGARQCPGRRVAEQELELLLAEILDNFHVDYRHGELGTKVRLFNRADREARFTFTSIR